MIMTVAFMQLRMPELSLIIKINLKLWEMLLKLMPLIIYMILSYKIKIKQREVAQLSQKRTVECSSELSSSVRLQTSLLSKASSDITISSALSVLMRQLGSSNVISPQQELCRLKRNKRCEKHWG